MVINILISFLNFLEKHPILGIFSGFGGFFLTYISQINEVLKFTSLGLGIVLTVLTIYANHIKKRKK